MSEPDLDQPGAVYWMLLTWLTLEPTEQMRHLPLPIPPREDPDARRPTRNPLLALARALWDSKYYWYDEHDRIEALEAFDAALVRLGRLDGDGPGIYCREEFVHGDAWRELRARARAALAESGLGPSPLPATIDFDDLVELVDADDVRSGK